MKNEEGAVFGAELAERKGLLRAIGVRGLPFLGAAACEGQATSGRKLRAFAGRSSGPPIPRGIEDVATGPPPGSVCGLPHRRANPVSSRNMTESFADGGERHVLYARIQFGPPMTLLQKKGPGSLVRNPGRRPAAAKTTYFAAAASACLRASMRLYQAARSAFRS